MNFFWLMRDSIVYALFAKSIHELNKEDLENFFKTEKRETDTIEFKSYFDYAEPSTSKQTRDKEKLIEIIRTICGLLNSDGGIVIWGSPTGRIIEGNKEKTFEGELTPVSIRIEPDQFVNRVASEITPTPLRIRFQPIPVSAETFYYVFEVDKSEFAPHQFRGTYYMRLDGSTRAAPHHYVEALMRRITYPRLECYLTFGTMRDYRNYAAVPVQLTIHNLSKLIPEKNVQYRILSDLDMYNPNATFNESRLNYGADISKEAINILHYSMAYNEEFVLLTDRLLPGSKSVEGRIMLTVRGEQSPLVTSKYELTIFGESYNGRTNYRVLQKTENVLAHEMESTDSTEEFRRLLMDNFERRLHTFPLIKQLHN